MHRSQESRSAQEPPLYFECGCPIYIKGRTPSGDLVPKQSTGFSDLIKVEALRDSLLTQVKGDDKDDINGPAVAECIEKYIVSRERELDERTLGQHKLALERLQRFLEGQGVQYIRSMTVDHLETFKTAGLPKHMADTTRATTDAKIRCFLRAAFRGGLKKR